MQTSVVMRGTVSCAEARTCRLYAVVMKGISAGHRLYLGVLLLLNKRWERKQVLFNDLQNLSNQLVERSRKQAINVYFVSTITYIHTYFI